MPLTKPYQAYLDRLYRESEAHEQRYSNTLYQHIPAIDKRVQKQRDAEICRIISEAA